MTEMWLQAIGLARAYFLPNSSSHITWELTLVFRRLGETYASRQVSGRALLHTPTPEQWLGKQDSGVIKIV